MDTIEERTFRVLNLGAGVQSTVVALMIHRKILPPVHCAIFADTQEEPQAVYRHLEWLTNEVSGSFPVWTRTFGKLGDALVVGRSHRKGHTTIPAFCLNERTGSIGVVRRQCTADYKIDVCERAIRREVLGLLPRQRWPKNVLVNQLFGLSYEEMGRAARVRKSFSKFRSGKGSPEFPLIDKEMTRRTCIKWLNDYGVPHVVDRSACVFCPYKSDAEWKRLKEEGPESGWNRAIEIDAMLRNASSKQAYGMKNPQFLHRSCRPLGEVDFTTPEQRGDQGTLGFMSDCEVLCGN